METITDLLTRADTFRRAHVRQGYQRGIGSLQETVPAPQEDEWLTRETILALRSLLRTAEPALQLGIRHLLRFLSTAYLSRNVQELSDALQLQQAAAMIHVPVLEGPVPLWQVAGRMARERKRVTRELLEEATTTVIRELNTPYGELWSRLNTVSEDLGYPSLLALWEEISGVPLDDLLKPLDAILRETDDTYRDLMDWHLKRSLGITLPTARRHDILALMHPGERDAWFPAATLLPTLERWLSEWGWSVTENTNLHIERHPEVAAGALCAPVDIPEHVYLALAPTGGVSGFAHALRETGKALLYASLPGDAPPELRCFPDPSLLEAQAEICEGLLRDQHWVEIYRHIQPSEEALRLAHLERLFIVRRYIGKCFYERALYENTTLDEKRESYVDALRRACGFGYPDAYFLHDVEPGFATLWRVRGWVLSAHIRCQLQRQYDVEWFRERDALQALRTLWHQSPPYPLEAILQRVGGTPMDVAPVAADLLSAL